MTIDNHKVQAMYYKIVLKCPKTLRAVTNILAFYQRKSSEPLNSQEVETVMELVMVYLKEVGYVN